MFKREDSATTMYVAANKVIVERVFNDEDCVSILDRISAAAYRGEYQIEITRIEIDPDFFKFLKMRNFVVGYYNKENYITILNTYDQIQKLKYYDEIIIRWD